MSSLQGIRCLVTAGPTYESIDPVRFIGNRSSGKMGIAIAEELAIRGADVMLILGPSAISVSDKVRKIVRVESSDEMYQVVHSEWIDCTIGIFAAAVADYKPKEVAKHKIKKNTSELTLELVKTKDILHSIGQIKEANQFLVGFALETNDEIENAKKKIVKKNLDLIVLNTLNDKGAGFQHDTNKITLIDKENKISSFELKTKQEVAVDIINYLETKL